MIAVHEAQCQAIAQRLRQQRVRPDEFLFVPVTPAEARREANYWIFAIAICQHTKSLEGVIEGRWSRGWDYLIRASRRVLDEMASAEAMASISGPRLGFIGQGDYTGHLAVYAQEHHGFASLPELPGGLVEPIQG